MKAISLVPGSTEVRLIDREEPSIGAPDEVKLQVLQVGICGTDREEAAGGRAAAPEGRKELVLGHEMMGKVVETGSAVKGVRQGDFALFTVRRGCSHCLPCTMGRPDMCTTGEYLEHGIKGLDGFQAEFVVDSERYLVKVPAGAASIGVLTEPLTIAEKAITEAVRIQFARLPGALSSPAWLYGRRCLVAGLGPVGLLAAMALRLRSAEVIGYDIVEPDTARPKWLEEIGGRYINGKEVPADKLAGEAGEIDLIFEATGNPMVELGLMEALALNGIYMLTGIPGGSKTSCIEAAEIIRGLVLRNQIVAGSVNAALDHYRMAVEDLQVASLRWGDHIGKLITNRYPPEKYGDAFSPGQEDEIKSVVEWAKV